VRTLSLIAHSEPNSQKRSTQTLRGDKSTVCLGGNIADRLCRHVLNAFVDEGGHIEIHRCGTVEGRERPREDVTALPEWIALVIDVSERERRLVVGFVESRTVMSCRPWFGNRGVPRTSIGRPFSESGSLAQTISPRFSSANAVTSRAPSRRFVAHRDAPRRTARRRSRSADAVGRRLGVVPRRP